MTFTDNGDGTATLAGNPAADSADSYTFTIDATNGVAPDATQSFTLTIEIPAGISSPDNASFPRYGASQLHRGHHGEPDADLTEVGNLPKGLTYSDGTISGTTEEGRIVRDRLPGRQRHREASTCSTSR